MTPRARPPAPPAAGTAGEPAFGPGCGRPGHLAPPSRPYRTGGSAPPNRDDHNSSSQPYRPVGPSRPETTRNRPGKAAPQQHPPDGRGPGPEKTKRHPVGDRARTSPAPSPHCGRREEGPEPTARGGRARGRRQSAHLNREPGIPCRRSWRYPTDARPERPPAGSHPRRRRERPTTPPSAKPARTTRTADRRRDLTPTGRQGRRRQPTGRDWRRAEPTGSHSPSTPYAVAAGAFGCRQQPRSAFSPGREHPGGSTPPRPAVGRDRRGCSRRTVRGGGTPGP